MAKYEYINGERRYYRGTLIWYDLYNEKHWYIETLTTLRYSQSCVNPPRSHQIHRHYFDKLVEAKRFIDDF